MRSSTRGGAGPEEPLTGSASRGCFRSLEMFRNLLREANDDLEKVRKLNREIYDLFKEVED